MEIKIDSIVNTEGSYLIEYTNGAHQFMLHHNVPYLLQYDCIRVAHKYSTIQIQADTIGELQELAKKYSAAVTFEPDGSVSIEFLTIQWEEQDACN